MNANQIHIGHEYAIAPYGKPNGNPFIPNAIRLVAYRTFGEQEPGNKRLTMFVEGFRLDTNTGLPIGTTYSKYRVRDVIDDWEEYEDRADQHEVEQARINAELERQLEQQRQARAEQNRVWREREEVRIREAEQRRTLNRNRLDLVIKGLVERGLNPNEISPGEQNVTITTVELERWLKSLTKVECMTCHRDLIMIDTSSLGGRN